MLQLQEKLAMKLGKYWFEKEAETNKIKGPFMQVQNKITRFFAFLWFFFSYKKMQLKEGLKSYAFSGAQREV